MAKVAGHQLTSESDESINLQKFGSRYFIMCIRNAIVKIFILSYEAFTASTLYVSRCPIQLSLIYQVHPLYAKRHRNIIQMIGDIFRPSVSFLLVHPNQY
jgi:hypothetical protein